MSLPRPSPNSTCLVTGASSGIGAEIARELARRGYGVTLVARRESLLRSLAEELADLRGCRMEVIPADLTLEESRSQIQERLEEMGLIVDILVNNAGVSTMGPVYKNDRAKELAMVRTDVEAVVDLCSIFVPGMVTRRRGAVLNTASTAAFQPLPGQTGYGASKAFVLSYSRALSAELEGTGVTVTALCPGPVETGFAEAAGASDEDAAASLPKSVWVSAPDVARAGIDAMDRGRQVVIPGSVNRILATAAILTPKGFVAKMVARRHPSLNNH
ncbi:MAG: SDR family NAD(P)-dependent oxidoreductase [Acidimicrobiales bacterium]|jgi:hypothetical protein